MDPLAVVLLGSVLFIASCLQGSIGFGMGMLAAPFIAIIDPGLLPGSIIMLAIVVSAIVLILDRGGLDMRGAGWALVGRVPGSILGAALVVVMCQAALSWAVAGTVLVGVAVSLRGWEPRVTRTTQAVAGALSGIMGTTTSVGGAPMSIIWQASEGPRLRGTMSAFFLVGSAISLAALLGWGAVEPRVFTFVVLMLLPVIAGLVASRFINRFLNRRRARIIALAASAAGAGSLIVVQLLDIIGGW